MSASSYFLCLSFPLLVSCFHLASPSSFVNASMSFHLQAFLSFYLRLMSVQNMIYSEYSYLNSWFDLLFFFVFIVLDGILFTFLLHDPFFLSFSIHCHSISVAYDSYYKSVNMLTGIFSFELSATRHELRGVLLILIKSLLCSLHILSS